MVLRDGHCNLCMRGDQSIELKPFDTNSVGTLAG